MADWKETGYVADSEDEIELDDVSVPSPNAVFSLSQVHNGLHKRTSSPSVPSITLANTQGDDEVSLLVECVPLSSSPHVLPNGNSDDAVLVGVESGGERHKDGLNYGWDHVHSITSSPIGTTNTVKTSLSRPIRSRSSSILSDAPSDLSVERAELFDKTIANLTNHALQDQAGQHQLALLARQVPQARQFRHRNPIQLQPFRIEHEQYRRTCRAGGQRPVRFVTEQPRSPELTSSPQQSIVDGASHDSNSVRLSLDMEEGLHNPNTSDKFAEEPLPHITSLLQHYSKTDTSRPFKKRKFNRPGVPHDRDIWNLPDEQHQAARGVPVPRSPPISRSITPTGSFTTSTAPKFYQADVPVTSLPTPLPSSETRLFPRRAVIDDVDHWLRDDEDSDNDLIVSKEPGSDNVIEVNDVEEVSTSRRRLQRSAVDHESTSESEQSPSQESSDEDPSIEMRRVKKRIRGVLPASWLKLDLVSRGNKNKKITRAQPNTSPISRSTRKSIARPVTKTNSWVHPSTSLIDSLAMEFDNDSASSQMYTDGGKHSHSPTRPNTTLVLDLTNVESENERVNSTRLHHNTAQSHLTHQTQTALLRHKRQQRLDDLGITSRQTHAIDMTHADGSEEATEDYAEVDHMLQKPSSRQNQSLKVRRSRSQRRLGNMGIASLLDKSKAKHKPLREMRSLKRTSISEFKVPRLSILDATSSSSHTTLPTFLRVAKRAVRGRKDQGRHSPTRKFLRLANREDTQEVNDALSQWRRGTIVATPTSRLKATTDIPRKPLRELCVNEQPRKTPNPPKHKVKPKRRTILCNKPRPVIGLGPGNLGNFHVGAVSSTEAMIGAPNETSVQVPSNQQPRLLEPLHRSPGRSRPALLEDAQEAIDRVRPAAAFRRGLQSLDGSRVASRPIWYHYLQDLQEKYPDDSTLSQTRGHGSKRPKSNTRAPKKKAPKHLVVSTDEFPLGSVMPNLDYDLPIDSDGDVRITHTVNAVSQNPIFKVEAGIFSTTCDVVPLPAGTRFHDQSLIGRGDLSKILFLDTTTFDLSRGSCMFVIDNHILHCGPWTEALSADLVSVLENVRQKQDGQQLSHDINVKQQLLNFILNHLTFIDSIDRGSFLQFCLNATQISASTEMALDEIHTHNNTDTIQKRVVSEMYTLLLLSILLQIGEHASVPPTQVGEISRRYGTTFEALGRLLGKALEALCQESKVVLRTPAAPRIYQNAPLTEAFIVMNHLHDRFPSHSTSVLQSLFAPLRSEANLVTSNHELDQRWRSLFVLLSIQELDARGNLEVGRRFKQSNDDWRVIRGLIQPVFDAYMGTSRDLGRGFNAYTRAIYGRCHNLITHWGWRRCEVIIGYLFDFFAQSGLKHLRNEDCQNSPSFLSNLGDSPSLSLEPRDRCFHILLKIIGLGIQQMRRSCTDRKIRNLVWRLMPNHGRTHPKDEEIRQDDLDALRNHHELICTLYWASPVEVRPKISALCNLVEIEQSHKAACHINIRAWLNLVRYQLSTDEPQERLEPFVKWQESLLQQLQRQRNQAQVELEQQVMTARHVQGLQFSDRSFEALVLKNQRQVDSVMIDALDSLRRAIELAQQQWQYDILLTTQIGSVLGLLDLSKPHTFRPVAQALLVIDTFTQKLQTPFCFNVTAATENDDSQDYGDWTGFSQGNVSLLADCTDSPLLRLHDPLKRVVSDCFGADATPGDHMLETVLKTWLATARVLVKSGHRSWSDYIGTHGSDTWDSLRDTDQRRKYSAQFLVLLLECDKMIYINNESFFHRSWFEGLVARESQVKFQHRLTSALLNVDGGHPMLQNLPFSRDRDTDKFNITLPEFSSRRILLLSSILSNMRLSSMSGSDDSSAVQQGQKSHLKVAYAELLRQMMVAMKRNYQELGQGSHATGAYVVFVQKVIELLQQYTSGICTIDRFFTDNVGFPLPIADPSYVVGQLKHYGLRLHDARMVKELVIFLQSGSERAAIDGQQEHLTDQLSAAMSQSSCQDVPMRNNLRTFIIEDILPIYLELAFETGCGWILALPFLRALVNTAGASFAGLDLYSMTEMQGIGATFAIFTRIMCLSVCSLTRQVQILQRPATQKTLSLCFDALTELLPCLDYIIRFGASTPNQLEQIDYLIQFATIFLHPRHDPFFTEGRGAQTLDYDILHEREFFNSALAGFNSDPKAELHDWVRRELTLSLTTDWMSLDGQYFVVRGPHRREVPISIGTAAEEEERLKAILSRFCNVCATMPFVDGAGTTGTVGERLDFSELII